MPNNTGRWITLAASMLIGGIATTPWVPAAAQTLERIRSSTTLKLGYDPDARPFSFEASKGSPDGYAVALCNKVADSLKTELNLPQLNLQWVALENDSRSRAAPDGVVDLVCGAEPVTLSRRKEVSFSLPIFPSGTGAVVSASAPVPLREVLEYGQPASRPVWRGSPARTILEHKTFSAISGTTSERWLSERINTFQLAATVVPASNYQQGIDRVRDGSSSVLFGDLALLMDAAARSDDSGNLIVLKRHFTVQPLALEMARNNEDFRLAVDRALSRTYAGPEFRAFFTTWFGPPDEAIETFFRQTVLPE
jgi:polar amino acid transport system substrate-binding protein